MQTFLPYQSFIESARVLDRQRLGKQRVEASQILLALTGRANGWKNHPAVKMWKGFENSLCCYGMTVCEEWQNRGYKDSLWDWFEMEFVYSKDASVPPWVTPDFCTAHQSNLVRKMPEHYRKFFPDVPDNLEYIWPVQ